MKRPALHFVMPLLVFLALPFAYNSCQGGLLKNRGFASAKNAQCKVGLYKGALAKLEDQAGPSPFASGKVRLTAPDASGLLRAKTTSSNVELKAGETLNVILDNSCIQLDMAAADETVITKGALASNATLMELDTQSYLWTLDRDYSSNELEALAQAEACVAGISWNQKYKFQAFSDTGAVYQGYLPVIRAEPAFERFYGGSGMSRTTGAPVVIAVVDTGVDFNHPDLSNNLWRHAYGVGIDITTLGGTVSYNPMDISGIGHGTHVSGMIAAVSDNAQGIVGVMPFRAQVMPIKLFTKDTNGDLTTTSQHFFNAVRFAHQNGAHVINLSLGNITSSPNTDPVAEAAVTEAVAKGSTVVTVTGNADNGTGAEINGNTLTVLPGMYATRAGVISVGSIDTATGTKSNFSHYSTTYGEIAAPGAEQGATGLYSTLPNNTYGRLAGTSQAAPQVSAAAALVVGLIREVRGMSPTPAEVERLILSSAAKDSRLSAFFKDGNRLDLLNLVQKINAEYPDTGSMDLSSLDCSQ